MAYGLSRRGLGRAGIAARVDELLDMVGLPGIGGRYPAQLSGGQQQRVALVRALAPAPGLLLLDEPLSNLDARLRREVRLELRALQKRLGITALFVTHDQEEALALADRIVVMQGGRVEQIGEPKLIYRTPTTVFAAEFVGEANLIPATAVRVSGERVEATIQGGRLVSARATGLVAQGDTGHIVVRQEDVSISSGGGDGIAAMVEVTAFLGSSTICVCRCPELDLLLRARLEGGAKLAIGQEVRVSFIGTGLSFLPKV